MDTSNVLTVPIQQAPAKAKVSWARLFLQADDAALSQMVGKGQLMFIDSDGGQTPIYEGVQDFIVVVLSGQVLDGYARWGLALPTITPTNESHE